MKAFDYRGVYTYFLTLAAAGRRPLFRRRLFVAQLKEELLEAAHQHGFDILCYCFMPDHVHALAVGLREDSDLAAFVRDFKQRTGFDFRQRRGRPLWQRSYYDHVVRRGESLRDIGLYVLNNPVRKGLVDDWQAYEFSGGPFKDELRERPPEKTGQT